VKEDRFGRLGQACGQWARSYTKGNARQREEGFGGRFGSFLIWAWHLHCRRDPGVQTDNCDCWRPGGIGLL